MEITIYRKSGKWIVDPDYLIFPEVTAGGEDIIDVLVNNETDFTMKNVKLTADKSYIVIGIIANLNKYEKSHTTAIVKCPISEDGPIKTILNIEAEARRIANE